MWLRLSMWLRLWVAVKVAVCLAVNIAAAVDEAAAMAAKVAVKVAVATAVGCWGWRGVSCGSCRTRRGGLRFSSGQYVWLWRLWLWPVENNICSSPHSPWPKVRRHLPTNKCRFVFTTYARQLSR